MFNFSRKYEDGLEIYKVFNEKGTIAKFAPSRGGLLTEFIVDNIPLLYLDLGTLRDLDKNVRGGNPVLFPICGPLKDDKYNLADGRTFTLQQHGLARKMVWEVLEINTLEEKALITLQLKSNSYSRQCYPFDFRLIFTYVIEEEGITIIQRYCNQSPDPMPFYAGFHPYFYAPGLKAVSLNIPSATYNDLVTGVQEKYLGYIDFNLQPETNVVFTELTESECWFEREDGFRVTVKYDDNFPYIVLWALRDKDFLCIEPWMGNNYDLNNGKAKVLKSGEELVAEVSFDLKQIR